MAAEGAAGFPAITTIAARSASTILIPKVRMSISPYRDFRIDFPVAHTYTPECGTSELKMIFAANLPISRIAFG
jgi:hypothetical protein